MCEVVCHVYVCGVGIDCVVCMYMSGWVSQVCVYGVCVVLCVCMLCWYCVVCMCMGMGYV